MHKMLELIFATLLTTPVLALFSTPAAAWGWYGYGYNAYCPPAASYGYAPAYNYGYAPAYNYGYAPRTAAMDLGRVKTLPRVAELEANLRLAAHALMAANNGLMPTMFITRVRL